MIENFANHREASRIIYAHLRPFERNGYWAIPLTRDIRVLDLALNFLADEVNVHIVRKLGTGAAAVKLTKLVDDAGKLALDANSLALTLINLEEDRVLRNQLPEYSTRNGKYMRAEPDLRLNLDVMIAAHFQVYDQALKYLSLVLGCFQSQPAFRPEAHPALPTGLQQLAIELQSPSFEQLNQIWAYLGTKFLPSAIYKVRLVVLRDEGTELTAPIRSFDRQGDSP